MLHIKILGAGCSNCERLHDLAHTAVASLGIDAQIDKITDYQEMMKYGILQTPALVIDEQVVTVGKVPSLGDLTAILTTVLAKAEE